MLFLTLLLSTVTENPETTIMARPSGAPYVFYKKEDEEEAIALAPDSEVILEDQCQNLDDEVDEEDN